MKRLCLFLLLGALAAVSCAKVVPEAPEREQNQPEQNDPEDLSQGFRMTFQMDGIPKLEIEAVDGYPLGLDGNSIITSTENLVPGEVYEIKTLPCDVYGGYRLSIFRNGQVADFYGVHQVIEEGQ
ncbi:MAG: hypothetical protein ACI4TM_00225 [Candidatus Cryptobacteroides sp.]